MACVSTTTDALMSTSLMLDADNSADVACFADASYPLSVQLENHMPRDIVLPAVPGLFLRHCTVSEGCRRDCTVSSFAQLQQLAWDVAQIVQLNGYRHGVCVHRIDVVPTRQRTKKNSVAVDVKEATS